MEEAEEEGEGEDWKEKGGKKRWGEREKRVFVLFKQFF